MASSHYIRAGAAGTNDGSSWANAFPTLAAANIAGFIRGDTYYIAGGTYNETLYVNVNLSGSLWIYLKKANVADNGADPGWQASYGTDVAYINATTAGGVLDFDKGYVSLDGVTGSGTSGHGIVIYNAGLNDNNYVIQLENSKGPFSVSHCEIKGSGFRSGTGGTVAFYYSNGTVGAPKNFYCGYCWIHEVTTNGIIANCLVGTSYLDYGMLFENNVVSETGGCVDPDKHGQGMQLGLATDMAYCIIRNNIYRNCVGSASIAFLGGSGPFTTGESCDHHDLRIYNNLFYFTDYATYSGGNSPGVIWQEDQRNGHTGVFFRAVTISNNVIFNAALGQLSFDCPGTGVIVENNIWESCYITSSHGGISGYYNNAFYNCSGAGVISGVVQAAGALTSGLISGSSTAFVNTGAFDFRLKVGGYAVGAGLDLSTIYTTDFNGVLRIAPWDLGAYKYITLSLENQRRLSRHFKIRGWTS